MGFFKEQTNRLKPAAVYKNCQLMLQTPSAKSPHTRLKANDIHG